MDESLKALEKALTEFAEKYGSYQDYKEAFVYTAMENAKELRDILNANLKD